MTREEKELLLRDLSARLPYGVIVRHTDCIIDDNYNETGEFHYTKGYLYDICRMDDMTTTIIESEGEREGYEHICLLERTVPYLRPMSSMTEEEKRQYMGFIAYSGNPNGSANFVDWLNEHHFDYRTTYDESKEKWLSMIGKGLAIEVTEENNPYK